MAIEEEKDITTPKLDKLIGSLQIFKLNFEEEKHDKMKPKKNIVFNVQNLI